LPSAFDPASYRRRYRDVQSLSDNQLIRHWRQLGRKRGRNAACFETREQLLECLVGLDYILEIGPFDKPSLEFLSGTGTTCHYADYLSRDDLVERARKIPGKNPCGVPNIDYILMAGGYSQISLKYDAVVSHHCLEHQPDLVGHFLEISELLEDTGFYLCTLPDHRMCFDHFLPATTLVDLLAAHLEKRTRPNLHSVIEHRCFTEHHWSTSTDPTLDLRPSLREQLEAARNEFENNNYVDVHCWKFTRKSLTLLLRQLIQLRFLPAETKFRVYSFGSEIALAISFSEAAHSLY
jgi:SAM-dependent methyltransferase